MTRPVTTYIGWKNNFYKHYNVGEYRLGQHFVNCFIKEEDDRTRKLWEMTGEEAELVILEIIEDYNWYLDGLEITMKQPWEYT